MSHERATVRFAHTAAGVPVAYNYRRLTSSIWLSSAGTAASLSSFWGFQWGPWIFIAGTFTGTTPGTYIGSIDPNLAPTKPTNIGEGAKTTTFYVGPSGRITSRVNTVGSTVYGFRAIYRCLTPYTGV